MIQNLEQVAVTTATCSAGVWMATCVNSWLVSNNELVTLYIIFAGFIVNTIACSVAIYFKLKDRKK